MDHPLQTRIPYRPWANPALSRLPSLCPHTARRRLIRDAAFAGQMALRDRLIRDERARPSADADRSGPPPRR